MHRMIYSIYYLKHKWCFNIIRLYAKSFYQINKLYSQLKIFIFFHNCIFIQRNDFLTVDQSFKKS